MTLLLMRLRAKQACGIPPHLDCDSSVKGPKSESSTNGRSDCREGNDWNPNSDTNLARGYMEGFWQSSLGRRSAEQQGIQVSAKSFVSQWRWLAAQGCEAKKGVQGHDKEVVNACALF